MVWTAEDIEKVRKFIDIKNKGHYVETHELTTVYNRVLEKHVNNTSCGSCLRQRVEELERALRRYEADKAKKEAEEIKAQENAPQVAKEDDTEQINEVQSDINDEPIIEQTKEENNDGDNTKSHKTKGRKKKQESAG